MLKAEGGKQKLEKLPRLRPTSVFALLRRDKSARHELKILVYPYPSVVDVLSQSRSLVFRAG
jgi:hypothetical protein